MMKYLKNFLKEWPPFEEIFKRLLRLFVLFYRGALSPFFGGSCRFHPTCSEFAEIALKQHPPLIAIKYITLRILKCRPGGPYGFDPVPEQKGK